MGQRSPHSPMHGSNSLASSASTIHMSQSSGSPNSNYPYSHSYWPQPSSPPLGAPAANGATPFMHGGTPFMQAQYAPSNSFSSGTLITCMGEPSERGGRLFRRLPSSCQTCTHIPNKAACLLLLLTRGNSTTKQNSILCMYLHMYCHKA